MNAPAAVYGLAIASDGGYIHSQSHSPFHIPHSPFAPMRPLSKISPQWWDYTTLDREILDDAARLEADDLLGLARPGFAVKFYDTLEDFYLAEALEYITAWRQATADRPAGICGPIGPTEQLPLVARLVNELEFDLRHAHFWGMDEWVVDGREAPEDFPLSFAKADMELCFDRIHPRLRMPRENIHFPKADATEYVRSYDRARCVVMQGGQGEVKHWAFNDPPKREGQVPGPAAVAGRVSAAFDADRGVAPHDDHPERPHLGRRRWSRACRRRPSASARPRPGGPKRSRSGTPAATTTLRPAAHDADDLKRIPDSAVPMSLLADHPNVQFNFYRPGIGSCATEMH